jgi:glycerol-1-phosphate dehydrogenase [NAD(P)+]
MIDIESKGLLSSALESKGQELAAAHDDLIERLLAGTCPDPDGGPNLAVATRRVIVAPSLADDLPACLDGLPLGRKLAVVSDPTTHRVLGAAVERALAGRRSVAGIRLDDAPHADEDTVAKLVEATHDADALVAVGSGTINDICKYAATRAGKPYVAFATAPSMNGYVSTSAAITVHGHKKSLPAQAPLAVFLDLAIMAAAPPRMIRSGLGDSLCRSTAQADWLLAHRLLGQPYRTMPFALLAEDEGALFAQSDALMRGDLGAMERLVRTLILSGFGTAICGSSHAASQGEHLISHYADMLGDPRWPAAFHGEQVGVATLTMARLQERVLDARTLRVEPDTSDRTTLADVFGEELGGECWSDFRKKRFDRRKADEVNEILGKRWDSIRAEIAAVIRPATELDAVLARAGAPRTAAELGWPHDFYVRAVSHARLIRNRYTFLDLASGAGLPLDS